MLCDECNKDMSDDTVDTCFDPVIVLGGESYQRDTEYYDVNERCHDCNIKNERGNLHHLGCDMERCPNCKGQLISCGCWEG